MIAYPITAWNRQQQPFLQNGIVSTLLDCLHEQMQRNLMQMITGEDGSREDDTPVPALADAPSLRPLGESTDMLPNPRACTTVRHRSRQVVMAMRTADNRLALESWRVNADGVVNRTGVSGPQPDQVCQVDLAHAEKFVVAYCSLNHELRLVSWDISNTGAIYRAGTSQAWREPIRRVRLQALGNERFITACVTRERRLQLITWQVGADAAITQIDEHAAQLEDIGDVALAVMGHDASERTVVTATRLRSGAVIHQMWYIQADGSIVAGAQASVAGSATFIQLTVGAHGHLVSALRTQDGQLRLLVWQCQPERNTIHLMSDQLLSSDGPAARVRRFELTTMADLVVVTVMTCVSSLKLIPCHVSAEGRIKLGQESVALAAAPGPITLCPQALDGNAPLLMGMSVAPGVFKLMTWQSA